MDRRRRFVQVVMLGDSITWSHNVPFGERYGDHVERELQDLLGDGALVDAAICGDGGDTVGQALLRLDRDVLAYEPDAVLINLGCNNTIRERGHAERDLCAVVEGIEGNAPRARIVLETIPTIIERLHAYRTNPEVIRAGGLMRITRTRTNRVIRRVAGRYGLPLHDRFGMFQAAVARRKSLDRLFICGDGIHLTAAGNRHFAKSAAALLAACLADLPEPSPRRASSLLAGAEENPAFRECCRTLEAGGLELFLRGAGSWARLMLQQARSGARHASCLTESGAVRRRAARVAAMAGAFSALQRILPPEAHGPMPDVGTQTVRWALEQLDAAGDDPMVRLLRRHLRPRGADPAV
jgi:lysophospholipase L1-like esterase